MTSRGDHPPAHLHCEACGVDKDYDSVWRAILGVIRHILSRKHRKRMDEVEIPVEPETHDEAPREYGRTYGEEYGEDGGADGE